MKCTSCGRGCTTQVSSRPEFFWHIQGPKSICFYPFRVFFPCNQAHWMTFWALRVKKKLSRAIIGLRAVCCACLTYHKKEKHYYQLNLYIDPSFDCVRERETDRRSFESEKVKEQIFQINFLRKTILTAAGPHSTQTSFYPLLHPCKMF